MRTDEWSRLRLAIVRPPALVLTPCRSTERKSAAERSDSRSASGGETLAALVTARLEHGATGTGPHSVPESVATLTTPNLGLIRTLHD